MKVGSLRWLEASASKRWSSIKLNDVWLLVLRCFIFLLLAVALAKPVWEGAPTAAQARKAVYISPELLHNAALRNIKPTVAALLQRGYTLHRYTPAFEPLPSEQWLALSSNPGDSIVSSGNYWGLLPALAERHPQPQDSVWLFTSDQQRHFAGAPAPLQENIQWIPVALEGATKWIQAAFATGSDSIQLTMGHSTRAGTTFSRTRILANVPSTNIQGLQVRLVPQGDSLWAAWGSSDVHRVLVRRQPLQITIAHDKGQQEARYLQAAIKAISHYTGIPMAVQAVPAAAPSAAIPFDWLFWLSGEEVPQAWVQQVEEQGNNLWIQPAAEPTATTAKLTTAGGAVKLHRLAKTVSSGNNTSVWHSSEGEAVLTRQPMGRGNVYYFRSGFSPAWSQLGQSALLPELLLPMLLPQQAASTYDARALEEVQLKPIIQAVKAPESQKEQQYPLLPWVVLLAFLLFLAERFITSKRTKV